MVVWLVKSVVYLFMCIVRDPIFCTCLNTQNICDTMAIVLPELPWEKDALAPHISAEVSYTAVEAAAATTAEAIPTTTAAV